jgi:5'-3' exoribonuclease 2
MGVPAFFRWLSMACPKVVMPAKLPEATTGNKKDGCDEEGDGRPSIDCLYLDMNALIHPCSHPTSDTDIPIPATEAEMHRNIKEYIDMVVEIVGPQKLLYLAIDGVAPRAKMNQQRGRRFRSAQEIYAGQHRKRKLAELWLKEGFEIPQTVVEATHWDYNVITPGTVFMKKVSEFLRNYIAENLLYNPKWTNLKVIFSDANCPGEGEHKILDFIRRQRAQPGYDPNTSHCIYGADADLIMLSLSTHEPHFYIIREGISNNLMQKNRDYAKELKKTDEQKKVLSDERQARGLRRFTVDFNLISIIYVREYIEMFYSDLKGQIKFRWNVENLIDDFVFLCFFGGNDFLPHLPALNIHQGGIDILMHLYKRMLPNLGGYITTGGEVNLTRIEKFMKEFAKSEEAILKQIEENQKELVVLYSFRILEDPR